MITKGSGFRYSVKSLWEGKYPGSAMHGATNSLSQAVWWFISWSVITFFRVLANNKYHYGNIFCIGKRITDEWGNKI